MHPASTIDYLLHVAPSRSSAHRDMIYRDHQLEPIIAVLRRDAMSTFSIIEDLHNFIIIKS